MAYGAKYRYDGSSYDGHTHRIELVKSGYAGAVDELPVSGKAWCHPQFHGHPIYVSEITVPIEDDGTIQSEIESGGEDGFRVRYSIDDGGGFDVMWEGRIVPALERWSADRFNDAPYVIQASDGLGLLRSVRFKDTRGGAVSPARLRVTSIITRTLDYLDTGFSTVIACERYPFVDGGPQVGSEPLDSVFAYETAYGDYLTDEQRRWLFAVQATGSAGRPVETASAFQLLVEYCHAFGCRLYMWGGAWRMIEEELLSSSSYTAYTYPVGYTSGGGTSNAETKHVTIPAGWLAQEAGGMFESITPVRQASMYLPIRQAPIINGAMQGTLGSLPTDWVEVGTVGAVVTATRFREGNAMLIPSVDNTTLQRLGPEEALNFLGTANQVYIETENLKALSGLGVRVQWCHAALFSPGDEPDYHFYIAIENVGDFLQPDGSWLTTSDKQEQFMTNRVGEGWTCSVAIDSDDLPNDGPVRITVLPPWEVDPNGPAIGGIVLDQLTLDLIKDGTAVAEGILTTATFETLDEGDVLDTFRVGIGDVPSLAMPSGLFVTNGVDHLPTYAWQRSPHGASAAGSSLHELSLDRMMNATQPTGSRRKRLFDGAHRVIPGTLARIAPDEALVIGGVAYLPEEIDWTAHTADTRVRAREAVWGSTAPTFGGQSLSGENTQPGGGVVPTSTGTGSGAGRLPVEIENRVLQGPLTVTSAEIAAATGITSVPVTAIGAPGDEVIRIFSGDPLKVINPETGEATALTASADFAEADSSITVNSFDIDQAIPAGSAVYLDQEHVMRNALRGGGVLGQVRNSLKINPEVNSFTILYINGGNTSSGAAYVRLTNAAEVAQWDMGKGVTGIAVNDFGILNLTGGLLYRLKLIRNGSGGENHYNVKTGSKHIFEVNSATELEIKAGAQINTPTGKTIALQVAGTTVLEIKAATVDLSQMLNRATGTLQIGIAGTSVIDVTSSAATFLQAPTYASDPGSGNVLARKSYVDAGDNAQMAAEADLAYTAPTISATYSQTEVQGLADDIEAVSDKLDALLAKLRTSGRLAT